jgi:hypothetical protein
MRANWQQCKHTPKAGVQWLALHVSLSPSGDLRMNRVTWEKLGGPAAVEVYFDSTNNRFGLKACHESAAHAFKMGKRSRYGARRISVVSVMKEHKIDITQTVQFFDADFDDEGILILDLRSARVPNRVLNHRARRAKKSPTATVL